MKKLTAILLSALIAIGCMSIMAVSVAAEDSNTATITVDQKDYVVDVGSTLIYTVNLKTQHQVTSGEFYLGYPQSILSINDVSAIDFPVVGKNNVVYNFNENVENEFRFNFSNNSNPYDFTNDGVLVTIPFIVSAAGTGEIGFINDNTPLQSGKLTRETVLSWIDTNYVINDEIPNSLFTETVTIQNNPTSSTEASEDTSATEASEDTSATEASEDTSATEASGDTSATEASEDTSATEASEDTSATEASEDTSATEASEDTSATEASGDTSSTEAPSTESTGTTEPTDSKPDTKNINTCSVSGIKAKTYTGKALTQSITVKDGTKTLKQGTDYTVSYKNNKVVGTATVIITGKGSYTSYVSKTFKITKAANPITVKAAAKTVKFSSVKRKSVTVSAITVKNAQGKVSYKAAAKSKLTVNSKTGKITVKKGLKKATYTIKVKVTAAATANYNSGSKTVTVKVIVK